MSRATDCNHALFLAHQRIAELEARAPTEWAYTQACKALEHWRREARRLGKLAGVEPRQMKRKAI